MYNIYGFYISKINLAYRRKQLKVILPDSKEGNQFLLQLQKFGVIQFFIRNTSVKLNNWRQNYNRTAIVVYLKYINTKPAFSLFKNYWKLRKKIFISPRSHVLPQHKYKTRLLVKTKHGILTIEECLKTKTGGLLVCAIYL